VISDCISAKQVETAVRDTGRECHLHVQISKRREIHMKSWEYKEKVSENLRRN